MEGMNGSTIEDMCNGIVKSVKERGRMKLNSDKGAYIFENGYESETVVLKEYFTKVHDMLIKKGLHFNTESKEYFISRPLRSMFKRDRPSPDDHKASSSKRSKSAPSKDEDEEKENSKPRGRQQTRDDKKYDSTPKSSRSKSENRPKKIHYSDFHGCTLIGDDFLLGFATFTLKNEWEKVKGKLQCGLCVSGLKISQATRKLKELKDQEIKRALIYLGTFDIIESRELIEMMSDFDALVEVCEQKGIKIVACTLAPIPLYHNGNREQTLEGFNTYLRTHSKVSVIDVNKLFSHDDPRIVKECYSGYLKSVSGSHKTVKLWTDKGRDLFKHFVRVNLGFAILDTTFPAVHDQEYLKIVQAVVLKNHK